MRVSAEVIYVIEDDFAVENYPPSRFEHVRVTRTFAALPRVGDLVMATEAFAGVVKKVEWSLGGDPLLTVVMRPGSRLPLA